jgi:hypothetical protein
MSSRLGLCGLRRTYRQDYETLFHVVILSKHHHYRHQADAYKMIPVPPPSSEQAPTKITNKNKNKKRIVNRDKNDKNKKSVEKEGEYIFGVYGLWVIAPYRHGAHNWEGVGELSARYM